MQVFISLSIVSWLHCWIVQRTSDRAGEDAEHNRCGVTFQSTVGAHSCSGLTGKLMGFCFLLFRWKFVKVGGCTGGSFRGAASYFGKCGLCLFSIIKALCIRFSTIWWWQIVLRTMVILHQIPFECPTRPSWQWGRNPVADPHWATPTGGFYSYANINTWQTMICSALFIKAFFLNSTKCQNSLSNITHWTFTTYNENLY